MKKRFFAAVVFFIAVICVVCLSACGGNKAKIKPDAPKDNRNVIVAENKGESRKESKERKEDKARQNANETVEKPPAGMNAEKQGNERPPENSRVEIAEGALKNKDKKWTAVFDNGEILDALCRLDVRVATVGQIEVSQRNDAECATTISVGGRYLSAFDFKEALGLRSTMIIDISRAGGEYTFTGFGEN